MSRTIVLTAVLAGVTLGVGLETRSSAGVRTSDRFEGTVGAEIAALPGTGGGGEIRGVLTLSTIPEGARILRASLYANDWGVPGATVAGRFAGNNLPLTSAFDSDGSSYPLHAYRFDVTPFVTGNGAYDVSLLGFGNGFGAALAVVFEHASLPQATVVVNDGATSIGEGQRPGSGATEFEAVLEGDARLLLFVQADDPAISGELVRLDGVVVGGPLDANTGAYASLVSVGVRAMPGRNRLEIEAFGDFFGWHLAILVSQPSCLAGNVNAAAGSVTNVLFVNDSPGSSDRRVTAFDHEPLTIFMAAPPSAQGPTPFALYGYAGLADQLTELPRGVGLACLPMPPSGGHPRLRAIWNNIGRPAALGEPTLPSTPAPSVVFSAPNGVRRRVTFFLQGLILDSASRNGRAAVTNGVTVEIR